METDVLYIFASVAFFIWAARSLVFWMSLWQKRRSTPTEFKTTLRSSLPYIFSLSSWITWFSIFAIFVFSLNDLPLFYTQVFVLTVLLLKVCVVVLNIIRYGIKRMEVSLLNGIIFVIALILTAIIFSFPLTEKYLWILLVDRMLFLLIFLSIFLVIFPAELVNDLIIYQVKKKAKET